MWQTMYEKCEKNPEVPAISNLTNVCAHEMKSDTARGEERMKKEGRWRGL